MLIKNAFVFQDEVSISMMKKLPIIKFTALIIAAATIAIVLSACGNAGEPALEYGDIVVTSRMYEYWAAHYKAVFMRSYAGISDTDEFWDSEASDGMTAEEYLSSTLLENVKKNVAGAWLFDYMGLKFTSKMRKEIKEGIKSLRDNLTDGKKRAFNEYLSQFGINDDILYDIYVMDAKVSYCYNYLFGKSGIAEISDNDRKIFLDENYTHIQHLYINNKYKYVLDKNGNYTYDEHGKVVTADLTSEEIAEKEEAIAAVEGGLNSEVSFEELWDEYSEDKYYEKGYYISSDTKFITEVVTAAFKIEVGEWTKVETQYGVHFIKRYAMGEAPWNDKTYADFFIDFEDKLKEYLFTKMLGEITDKITVYSDATSKIKLRDVKPSYYV
ncbi:MAG: hypothetical protein WBI55_09580 [Eubacteriales bacterium]|jgi:hypothetical protein